MLLGRSTSKRTNLPLGTASSPRPFTAGAKPRGREYRQQRTLPRAAGLLADISHQVVPEALFAAAGVIGVAGLATALVFGAQAMDEPVAEVLPQEEAPLTSPKAVDRENAVLVFGSTGKLGRTLTQQLLQQNRSVVAASRGTENASQKFEELGLHSGLQPNGQALAVEGGVDITDKETLRRKDLWQGVSQVAITVGPIFGRQSDGQMGFSDNMTSERVDAQGVENIIAVAKEMLPSSTDRSEKVVLPMEGEEGLKRWERVDDVIMGGQSSSEMKPSASGRGALWSGELVIEGGGFCGTRAKGLDLNLSKFDGIALRLKGDGQMYKINLKTADRADQPESTYAATFDTTGDWETINIPFREFVPVVRAKTDPTAPPLDPSTVRELGFRLSRFDFNSLANPQYKPGPFSLEVEGGIRAFSEPRPAIVLVSSAAVERNANIGDDSAARKRDIPILQLNPGGILNYKYAGESSLRSSGLPYAIVRPVGLSTERENEPFLLEASQGDKISGKISRAEAASMVVSALQTPASKGKTLEVRRSEAGGDQGKKSTTADLERLFLAAIEDWHRPRRGLPPLPAVVPPPPPPDEERVKEILQDPGVQAAAKRDRERRASSQGRQEGQQNGSKPNSNGSGNGAGQMSSKQGAQGTTRDSGERSAENAEQETANR